MKKSYYGLEPVDLKLFVLRIGKNLWQVLIALLIGCIIGGLIYNLGNSKETNIPFYQVRTDYQITYAKEAPGVQYVSYNEYSWNTILATEEFSQTVIDQVKESYGVTLGREEILQYYSQAPMSDIRIVSVQTKTNEEALTKAISLGVEKAMLTIGEEWEDIDEIVILSSSSEIQKRYFADYTLQATAIGGFIAVLLYFMTYTLLILMDTGIYLPKTFELRYHIPVFGMIPSSEKMSKDKFISTTECNIIKAHMEHYLNPEGVVYFAGVNHIKNELLFEISKDNWKTKTIGPVTEQIQILKDVKKEDSIILLVPYAKRKGQIMERTVELIQSMGNDITGAILVDVNPTFMKHYYGNEDTFACKKKGESI